jgi:hypothetical protein
VVPTALEAPPAPYGPGATLPDGLETSADLRHLRRARLPSKGSARKVPWGSGLRLRQPISAGWMLLATLLSPSATDHFPSARRESRF